MSHFTLTRIGQSNQINVQPLPPSVDITFNSIKFSVLSKSSRMQILKGVDGIFKAGTINAILGSSGSGKTTLLNILSKRINQTKQSYLSGEVKANNSVFSKEQFGQFGAYVMQEDVLLETMTVRECFEFAVNLKIQGEKENKTTKINQMVRILGLEKCQDTYIGGLFVKGISGGERKRTSIGYELINNPSVIILDEPTSGLDSFTAFKIISILRQLAQTQNKTVILTIHQPSADIWSLFDTLTIMSEGIFVYQGLGGNNIIDHFGKLGFKCPKKSNPADYFMKIISQQTQFNQLKYPVKNQGLNEKLLKKVENSVELINQDVIPIRHIVTSSWYQILCISQRQLRILSRNPILFKARLIQAILISLFIGSIYWRIPNSINHPTVLDISDKAGFLFFYVMGMFSLTLNPCVLTFPSERLVFLREQTAQLYSVKNYFLGKLLIDMIPTVLFPLISGLVVYWMVNLNTENSGKVLFFCLVSVLLSCCGLGFGYLCGTIFSDAKVALAVSPLFLMPFMLFSGFYKNSGDYASWIGWIQYLSPFNYGFIAIAINEFTTELTPYSPDPILTYNFNMNEWEAVGYLFAIFSVSIVISFVFLVLLKQTTQ